MCWSLVASRSCEVFVGWSGCLAIVFRLKRKRKSQHHPPLTAPAASAWLGNSAARSDESQIDASRVPAWLDGLANLWTSE
eukprot:6182240-Amphidinium_carterae.1